MWFDTFDCLLNINQSKHKFLQVSIKRKGIWGGINIKYDSFCSILKSNLTVSEKGANLINVEKSMTK